MLKVIVTAKEKTIADTKKTFLSWTTYDKKGKRYSVHFRKEIVLPKEEGTYEMEVDEKNFQVNNYKRYPEVWVSKEAFFAPYTGDEEKRAKAIKAFTGEEDD